MPSQTRPSNTPSSPGDSGQLSSRLANLTPAQRRLLQQKLQQRSTAAEPIAIVGMGCRLPGARNIEEYWRLIHDGQCATGKIPPSRWDADKYYDPTGETPGKMNVNTMGAVDDVDLFDAKLFGIAPREVFRMDPQQRLLLEVAWEAFESAGVAPADAAGTKCGVYVGICGSDYAKVPMYVGDHLKYIDAHIGTGNALSIASGRISYIYDLKGPSWVVDTACSSALVAVHSAVQAIRNGECDSALAGGVNLILTPEIMLALSKAHMLSTTGKVSPFDAGANGYVRGEGCGLVLMKKLTDAVADGDEILGVIRGSHVNQDGKTSGITAPNSDSQKDCIRAAIAQSGVPVERISYVEAHGTGTPLGDPIEFESLSQIFRRRKEDEGPVNVTSVKANIGHTETVAGIASLIKVLLLLKHKTIRPQLHLKELNPRINLEGTRLNVPTEAMHWQPNGPTRVAGVSSFGFGGTNAHVIVEEASSVPAPKSESERPLSIVTVSAKTDDAINRLAETYAQQLDSHAPISNGNGNGAVGKASVHEFAGSTTTRRNHFQKRLAVVVPDAAKAAELLGKAAAEKRSPAIHRGNYTSSTRPQIGMLFTGQGSQYPDMGRRLYETHPVFKASLDRCAEILDPLLDQPLLSVIFPENPEDERVNQTAFTQPALVAIECSMADLWKSWGVVPDVVAGHSVGEYAAAYVAGVLGLEEALQLITHRGRLMQSLPEGGAMAAIMAAPESVEKHLSGVAGDIGIAAYNGPGNTVISGDSAAVAAVIEKAEADGLTCKPLTVSHAFHSAHMDPMLDAFRRHADQHQFNVPKIKLVSNLSGATMNGTPPGPDYWTDHVRAAVQFTECGKAMLEEGVDVVIEVGPAPHLTGMMRAIAADMSVDEPVWLTSLRRGKDDWDILMGSVAEAYCNGVRIDWKAFEKPWPRKEVKLPHYPFQRERFWIDNSDVDHVDLSMRNEAVHPILGSPVDAAVENRIYESLLDPKAPRFLADHVVQGSCIVPGAAYMDMGLAAAKEVFGEDGGYVESVSIQKPLYISDDSPKQVQTTVSPERGGRCTYQVLSRDPRVENDTWILNVRGTIVRGGVDKSDRQANFSDDIARIRAEAVDIKTTEEFYEIMAGRSLDYGPCFQGISDLHRTHSEAEAHLVLEDSVSAALGDYPLHPAMLDSCVQAIAAVVPLETSGDYSPHTYMPVSVERVDVVNASGIPARVVAKRTSPDENEPSPEVVIGNIAILDAEDNLLAEMHGLQVYRVGGAGKGGEADFRDWMYGVKWEVMEQVDPSAVSGRVATIVAGEAESGAAVQLAKALESRSIPSNVISDAPKTDAIECTDLIVFADAVGNDAGYDRTLTATQNLLESIQNASRSGRAVKLHLITIGGQSHVAEGVSQDEGSDESKVFVDATGSALWGMGRVSQMEHPELAARLIDLDPRVAIDQQTERLIAAMYVGDEDQIAIRGETAFACRLRNDSKAVPEQGAADNRGPLPVPSTGAFRLRLDGSNSIDGLWIEQTRRNQPAAGQVELEVKAAGLNFSDVLKALGLYPGITDAIVPIGIECSGVVTSVGEGVDRFKPGDRVFGVAPYSFSSHAITNDYALAHLPAGIDDEEASTIPITFLTAYYGMVTLADLQPGERFLIHAGAGGVGIAAIQIAQQIGAEIYATAGSDEKHDFLRGLGVTNLYNSRTLDFAEQILEDTGREGVDVVLNSLPGEAIDRSIGILRAYGRFLEIGKTDIYSNRMIGLLPFQDNLSYHAIDLDRMLRQRGKTIEKLYREVLPFFESGDYKPLPMTNFTMPEIRDSFRYMQQRKNIGKVVVSIDRDSTDESESASSTGTWLITGGLGGLGLMVADWLIDEGHTNIALLGRRAPSESAEARIAAMSDRGASVVALQGDVTDLDSLKKAIESLPDGFPAISGVMHAAGVLADSVLLNMDREQLAVPMGAKVLGTLNLEKALADSPLENFVLFSSIAALMGSPGQGNYAAANAFLDGFAADRQQRGLPATVINWGPWAGAGMAVQEGRDDGMAGHGLRLLQPDAALDLMGACLKNDLPQVAAIDAIWGDMLAGQNLAKLPSLYRGAADLIESDGESADSGVDQDLVRRLVSLDGAQRKAELRSYFADLIGAIMGMEADEIQSDQPLGEMGLDSLMAIELKNTVETRLGVILPMARFMEGPSLQSLAEQVAELVGEEQCTATIGSTEDEAAGEASFDGRHELSAGQRALWFIHQLAPESTAYNIAGAIKVHGPLCHDALQQSFGEVVKRHDAYRTTFKSDSGKPYAQVDPDANLSVKRIDAIGWSDSQVKECVLDETHRSFDLENGPLIRVVALSTGESSEGQSEAKDEHVLVFSVHHIVSDFWSLVACMDQFREIYSTLRSDATLQLQDQTHQYRHFVDWQNEMLASPEGQKHRDYWHADLAGELPVLNLPTDRPRPPIQTYRGSLEFSFLDADLTGRLTQLANDNGMTLNMVLMAGYQLLLHKLTGQDDVLVGLPTSGRSRAELVSIAGYFVNPTVIRSQIAPDTTLNDYFAQIRKRTLGALEHQDYPLPMLVEELAPQRDPSRSTMFQTLFVMQKAQTMHDEGMTPFLMGEAGATMDVADLVFESMQLDNYSAQFDLSMAASENSGGTSLAITFNTDLFDRETVATLLVRYERLLRSFLNGGGTLLSDHSVLSDEEVGRLTNDWAQGEPTAKYDDEDNPAPVFKRFESQADSTPQSTAVVCGSDLLTYEELNARANQLAWQLKEAGAAPGERVGICLPRENDLVVAMLAVMKTGAAYVPLDPKYPAARLGRIIGGTGMTAVVTSQPHQALVAAAGTPILLTENIAGDKGNLNVDVSPDDIVYVIYTSGSTGDPKGAAVYHRGFSNLVRWYNDWFQIDDSHNFLVITSHGFDLTQKNFYAPLAVGGQLHLSQTDVFDPEALGKEIAAGKITLLNCTPSNLYPILDNADNLAQGRLASLRLVVLGGEPIDRARLATWQAMDWCSAEVVNSYGPTECSDVVSFHVLDTSLPATASVPLGGAIDGVRLYVLDANKRPVPVGVSGELYVGGICVGAGYINDAEMTAAKFVADPFASGDAKMYATGDVCRWLPSGVLEFGGRADYQVKIRGHRIELGEVEAGLNELSSITESIAIVREDSPGNKRIVAYVVTSEETNGEAIAEQLKDALPPQMIPAAIVQLDKLPLTPHGKVDRRALPAPDNRDRLTGAGYVSPRNETEQKLAELWAQILQVEQVGIHDNFFTVGGDSLLAIEAVSRMAGEGIRVTPAQLFQRQSIAELIEVAGSSIARAEDDDFEGAAPLTPIQRWFYDLDLASPEHFNLAYMLEVPAGLDTKKLVASADSVAARHDALRLRITREDAVLSQIADSAPASSVLEVIDLSHENPADQVASITKNASRIQQSFSLTTSPLVRFAYFNLGEAGGRLALIAHHLAIDPFSMRLLLEELMLTYTLGSGAAAPTSLSMRAWAAKLAEHTESGGFDAAADRWLQMVDVEIKPLPLDDDQHPNTVGSATVLKTQFSAAETAAITSDSSPMAVPARLLSAISGALQSNADLETVRFDFETTGRNVTSLEADLSRTAGWLVSMFPVDVSDCDASTIQTALTSIEDDGISFGALSTHGSGAIRERLANVRRPQIRFNYLGRVSQSAGDSGELVREATESTGSAISPENERTHLIEIDAQIKDDCLEIRWTFSPNRHAAARIEEIARTAKSQLV